MKIQINYNANDLFEAQKLYFFSSRNKYFYLFLGILLIGEALFFRIHILIGMFLLLFGFFILTYPIIFLRFYASLQFKKSPAFRPTITFEVNENFVRIDSSLQTGESKWDCYIQSRSNERMLILFAGHKIFQLIPKRVMSDEEWIELLKLVKSKIADSK